MEIRQIDEHGAVAAMPERSDFLRPGNSVAGPVIMTLCDAVVYLAILGHYGTNEGLHVVTSNLNIHFLARAVPGEIVAHCKLVKAGSRLVTADVEVFDHRQLIVAKATVSYMAVSSAR